MTIAEHFISSEQSVHFHLLKRLNKFSDHIDGTGSWLKIDRMFDWKRRPLLSADHCDQ
ncbi:hypothetical protein CUJ84_Chr002835 [Rhizobium leguminosarum]|uniref:Uncharacterized protein n=1 Tax=Rhizobium leguminosarum TaxID=384 RepID=A0A2K9Z4J4_RHILE|nr:hypothetical protein CUJ84_Chr002835 [Rhizobium leguminosarum]